VMMPAMILPGAVLTDQPVAGEVLVTHAATAPGDRLLVQPDSAPNGDTLVLARCGCSFLLPAKPAP